MLDLPPYSILDVWGISSVMDFFELVLMSIVVAFFLYYGINFVKKSRSREAFEVEKKLNIGYGFFFIGLAIGYGSYVLDRIGRFFTQKLGEEGRLFEKDSFYGISSAINRDYILFSFIGLGIGFIFLSYVVEKYILSRKLILTWICIGGFFYSIALRFIEVAVQQVEPDIVKYLGYIIYGVLALVLIMLLLLYGKIAKSSPIRSDLWNRSIAFIVGVLIMVVMLIFGNNQLSKGDDFIGENLLGPIITLVALFIMNYGFGKSK
nr:hypothetical protein [Candidatus Sigynarchaeum springense]